MNRTPGERLVINLFEWLVVSGVYLMLSYTLIGLAALSEVNRIGHEFTVTEVLCWLFLLPLKLLEASGVGWAGQMPGWMVNALVYGAGLWSAWRMFTHLRRRRPE